MIPHFEWNFQLYPLLHRCRHHHHLRLAYHHLFQVSVHLQFHHHHHLHHRRHRHHLVKIYFSSVITSKLILLDLIVLPNPKMSSSSSSSFSFSNGGNGSASVVCKPLGPNLKQETRKAASISSSARNSKPRQALKLSFSREMPYTRPQNCE